ncbi:MAG: methyltransferase [Planctomycetes bacterium]|nr:methyltransferase [Planctomycetota bacterium]
MSQQPPPPHIQMLQMGTSYWVSQSIYAAAKLGLADLVEKGPKSAEDLASATGMHAPSIYRLLRALASLGIFVEDAERRFGLTPLAECLLSRPDSQRAMCIMAGEEHFAAWGDIMYSMKTGKVAFDHVFQKPVFDYLAEHQEQAAIFDRAMTSIHGPETQAMVDAYDFAGIGTIVDIGGGNGTVIKAVLERYPTMRGILYDLAHVLDRARPAFQNSALGTRCQLISGSFFESVPPGGDAYLMRHIIHDWTDDQCHQILSNCRKVMKPGSRLLVVEMVIPHGNEPHFGKLLDLNMMIIPGGKERTEEEYQSLFQKAGFCLTRIVPTRMELAIVEGVPV